MINTYKFRISPASAVPGTISCRSDRHQQILEPCLKPVHVTHSHGWLIMNAPFDLEKALDRARLQMTQSAPVLLCAHFETEQAIYQLHVATRVQLNLQE
jgi:hypothetical protein